MAALLRGGPRRGYYLVELVSATHGHQKTTFSEVKPNVVDMTNVVPMAFSFEASGYEGPVIEKGVLNIPYVTKTLHMTISKDGFSFGGNVRGRSNASKHWSHLKDFHTSGLASATNCKLEMKTLSGILKGVGGRKSQPWTGWRSFSSHPSFESSELDLSHQSAESDEDFDFTNFPALKSSFFENYERPIEMQVRKKHVTWQSKAKCLGTDKKLTLDSTSKPRDRMLDFGLGNLTTAAPPLETGERLQGGFDLDISSNED